jgi:hypothetical protein
MLVTNAGGLWQEGKEDWKAEAKRRKITRPMVIHFFHMGYTTSKLSLMRDEKLWFVRDNGKCVGSQPQGAVNWPLWNR